MPHPMYAGSVAAEVLYLPPAGTGNQAALEVQQHGGDIALVALAENGTVVKIYLTASAAGQLLNLIEAALVATPEVE